jgi:hypothetical protein
MPMPAFAILGIPDHMICTGNILTPPKPSKIEKPKHLNQDLISIEQDDKFFLARSKEVLPL